MKLRRSMAAAALFGVALLTGCSGSTGPTAGTLSVSLTTPHTDDGGLLFTISGGPVDSIEASGYRLYYSRADANTLRLILTGELAAGTIARIHVPDTRQASRYTTSIGQVAARRSYAQRDPGQYMIALLP